jgi:acyl carrier protein
MPGIEEQIKQIIVDKLGVDEKQVVPAASFTSDLCTDSLDVFELVIEIENVFHITIPGEDMEKLNTVGALTDYTLSKSNHNIPGEQQAERQPPVLP